MNGILIISFNTRAWGRKKSVCELIELKENSIVNSIVNISS